MANLSSPPDVELIFILLLCCFPVHGIVKVHAFGVLPLPVPPDQVAAHAQEGYHRHGHNGPNDSSSDRGARVAAFVPVVLGVVAGCRAWGRRADAGSPGNSD